MLVKEFIKQKYIDDPGPKGTLARCIKSKGTDFPKRSKHETLRTFLEKYCGVSERILIAFDECYEEWKEHERTNH